MSSLPRYHWDIARTRSRSAVQRNLHGGLPLWFWLRRVHVQSGESRIDCLVENKNWWGERVVHRRVAYEATMRVASKRCLHVMQVNALYQLFLLRYSGWDSTPAVNGLGLVAVERGYMRASVEIDPYDDRSVARHAGRRALDRIERATSATNRKPLSIDEPLGLARVLAIELEEVLRAATRFKVRPPQRKANEDDECENEDAGTAHDPRSVQVAR